MGNKKKEKAAKGRGMGSRKADRRTRMNLWCVWLQISTGRYVLALVVHAYSVSGKEKEKKKNEKKSGGNVRKGERSKD